MCQRLFLIFIFLVLFHNLQANIIGIIQDLKGIVTVNKENVVSASPTKNNTLVYETDWIKTNQYSKTSISFRDGSYIRMFENTIVQFNKTVEYGENREYIHVIEVKKGGGIFYFGEHIEYALIKTCEGEILTNKKSLFYIYCDELGKLSINNLLIPIVFETINEKEIIVPNKNIKGLIQQQRIKKFIGTPQSRIEIIKGGKIKSISKLENKVYVGVQILPKNKNLLDKKQFNVLLITSKSINNFPLLLKTNNNGFGNTAFDTSKIKEKMVEQIKIFSVLDAVEGLDFQANEVIFYLENQ